MSRLLNSIMILSGVIFLTVSAQAASLQALHDVEHAAYLKAVSEAQARFVNPQVSINSMDKRLRLQACDKPLETFANHEQLRSGQLTIGVRCHSPVSWTVYVSSQVKVMRDVVVTRRALPADHILTADDIKLAEHDIASMRKSYLKDASILIGQKLKSPLPMGAVLETSQFKSVTLIHRGDLITLVAAVGNMEVRVRGEALANAGLGERVKVKNTSSERVVEGIVDAAGMVRIGMM